MSVYVKCYRCLVCNQLYSSKLRHVVHDENDAQDALFNATIGSRSAVTETHWCDDGNVGVGILAGFVRKLNEDDE